MIKSDRLTKIHDWHQNLKHRKGLLLNMNRNPEIREPAQDVYVCGSDFLHHHRGWFLWLQGSHCHLPGTQTSSLRLIYDKRPDSYLPISPFWTAWHFIPVSLPSPAWDPVYEPHLCQHRKDHCICFSSFPTFRIATGAKTTDRVF